ncbi:hypothetical protein LZ30DRAFT_715719 [Colletotrichum cereale]|nr:hypothetical protein LZ30DRAFT_715719 [Colletotrichum cereale]
MYSVTRMSTVYAFSKFPGLVLLLVLRLSLESRTAGKQSRCELDHGKLRTRLLSHYAPFAFFNFPHPSLRLRPHPHPSGIDRRLDFPPSPTPHDTNKAGLFFYLGK